MLCRVKMSTEDDNVSDQIFNENFEENLSTASAELETIEETSNDDNRNTSGQRQSINKMGIAGASKLNGDAEWLKQEQLLQSAKIDGKSREEIFRNLQEDRPHRKRTVKKSLFGDTFTPFIHSKDSMEDPMVENTKHQRTPFNFGFVQGFPWANDLAKVNIPKLDSITELAIMRFQIAYKKYLKRVDELSERYGSKIPVRTVYNCIEDETLYYLCYMSEMIPQKHRTDPGKLDRAVVHNVIMQYVPPGFSAFHRTLENELQQISINLAVNGLENIEQAWYKLIKLDKKYCTTVKPKLVIKILTKNL